MEQKKKVGLKEKFFNAICEITNFSIWRIVAYFIIYSFLGFIIETLFGIVTKGVWESRKSFLYGPFCGIYGVGAVIMIMFLQPFKKNKHSLFLGGFVVGSIVEYLVSFIGEHIFNVIWWNYSDMPLNVNGRICVFFSLFWGALGVYLLSYVNPKVDKLICFLKTKISHRWLKSIECCVAIFLVMDCLITAFALKAFFVRVVKNYNIDIGSKEVVSRQYDFLYGNKKCTGIIYKFFGDKKMIRTFPNLKLQDNQGRIVYFDSFFRDIQPYYKKISDPPIKQKIMMNIKK